ncbi:MAG TPA: hypothetical protein VHK24_09885 [Steroidobacter sp.]|nr:hypothetical protein [Steroidobacter sp.]
MFTDPRTLVDETLDRLETLAVLLADEVDERMHEHAELSPDARRCKEALLTMKVLIPKLREARAAQLFHGSRNPLALCGNCE